MSRIRVPSSLYWQTRLFRATRGFWRHAGNLESRLLREEIDSAGIDRPIYVCGLARSGTTILTELLEQHSDLTSHRYSDFPFTYTPYWKNWLRQRRWSMKAEPTERAHGDRIQVTEDSPEAIEEVIWMQFFDQLHLDESSEILDETTSNPKFEAFYRDHLRKLLMVRKADRYLSKGNYNISRIRYLLKLFSDARFVILIRNPVDHIASLQKQHRLFSFSEDDSSRQSRRVTHQLAASGHFEFGNLRTAINLSDGDHDRITTAWKHGDDITGWAIYWNSVYRHVKALTDDPAIARQCLLIRYEDLCDDSERVIRQVLDHCQLTHNGFESVIQHYGQALTLPDYYSAGFSDQEIDTITEHCQQTALQNSYRIPQPVVQD